MYCSVNSSHDQNSLIANNLVDSDRFSDQTTEYSRPTNISVINLVSVCNFQTCGSFIERVEVFIITNVQCVVGLLFLSQVYVKNCNTYDDAIM